jgi:hypothetical protein
VAAVVVYSDFFRRNMYLSQRIRPICSQTGSERKEKLQRSLKLLFIFLEAFSDPFVTTIETAPQSSLGTRAKLHNVEAAEEGLLLSKSAEYAAS